MVLPRAGLPDQRERRAGRHPQVDPAQGRLAPLPVAKAHVLEADVALDLLGRQLERAVALGHIDRQVEVLEDPLEQGQRALDLDADRQQRLDREEQPRLKVVKATSVPIEIAAPPAMLRPPNR